MTPKKTPCVDVDRVHFAPDVSLVDRGEGVTEERVVREVWADRPRREGGNKDALFH